MSILPVNKISLNNRNISFGHRKNSSENLPVVSEPSISRTMKSLPVVVLFTLNPSLMEAKLPEMQMSKEIKTELVSSPQQSTAPFGWASLDYFGIKKVIPGKTKLYDFDMVFATSKNAGVDYKNEVTDVFLIPRGKIPANSEYINPPKIEEVVYHNTRDGQEFYGVKIFQTTLRNGEEAGAMRNEVIMDSNSVKELLKLLSNQTIWKNSTRIPLTETNTATRMKPILY